MSDHDAEVIEPSDIDTGEPIAVLRRLEEPADATFGERLHRRIHRRRLSADLGRLSWEGPFAVVVEMLKVFFGVFGPDHNDGHGER